MVPRKRAKFCSLACYQGSRRKRKAKCEICGGEFFPMRNRDLGKCCSLRCKAKLQKTPLTVKVCKSCGMSFVQKRKEQLYCSYGCKIQGRREDSKKFRSLGLKAITGRPGKRHDWRLVERSEWSASHLWYWLCDQLADRGVKVQKVLEVKGWSQLSYLLTGLDGGNGEKGVSMDTLCTVLDKFVELYPAMSERFSWGDDVVFHPGMLLGYWHSIEAKIISNQAGFGSIYREWDESVSDTDWSDLNEEDYGGALDSWRKEEKKAGRITIRDWERLPYEKWSVTTLWEFVYKSLRDKDVRVIPLKQAGREKLKGLVTERGMDETILFAERLIEDFEKVSIFYDWHDPFTPKVFVGFYPSISRYFSKKYQYVSELIKDRESSFEYAD